MWHTRQLATGCRGGALTTRCDCGKAAATRRCALSRARACSSSCVLSPSAAPVRGKATTCAAASSSLLSLLIARKYSPAKAGEMGAPPSPLVDSFAAAPEAKLVLNPSKGSSFMVLAAMGIAASAEAAPDPLLERRDSESGEPDSPSSVACAGSSSLPPAERQSIDMMRQNVGCDGDFLASHFLRSSQLDCVFPPPDHFSTPPPSSTHPHPHHHRRHHHHQFDPSLTPSVSPSHPPCS